MKLYKSKSKKRRNGENPNRLIMSGWPDSNRRPLRPERSALPGCATPRVSADKFSK